MKMPKFNEHALEMSIMELFTNEEYVYLSGNKICRENTDVSFYEFLNE